MQPLHGPSPSISPSRLHVLRIAMKAYQREKIEKGWNKVFVRSTWAQFAEIANTKSLSAALMGSSIWPPNGPILRNARWTLHWQRPVSQSNVQPIYRGVHGGLWIWQGESWWQKCDKDCETSPSLADLASFLQGSPRAIAVHDACPLLQNNSDKSGQKRGHSSNKRTYTVSIIFVVVCAVYCTYSSMLHSYNLWIYTNLILTSFFLNCFR